MLRIIDRYTFSFVLFLEEAGRRPLKCLFVVREGTKNVLFLYDLMNSSAFIGISEESSHTHTEDTQCVVRLGLIAN